MRACRRHHGGSEYHRAAMPALPQCVSPDGGDDDGIGFSRSRHQVPLAGHAQQRQRRPRQRHWPRLTPRNSCPRRRVSRRHLRHAAAIGGGKPKCRRRRAQASSRRARMLRMQHDDAMGGNVRIAADTMTSITTYAKERAARHSPRFAILALLLGRCHHIRACRARPAIDARC